MLFHDAWGVRLRILAANEKANPTLVRLPRDRRWDRRPSEGHARIHFGVDQEFNRAVELVSGQLILEIFEKPLPGVVVEVVVVVVDHRAYSGRRKTQCAIDLVLVGSWT